MPTRPDQTFAPIGPTVESIAHMEADGDRIQDERGHRNAVWNEALGNPLNAAEQDYARRRLPVCNCPRLLADNGRFRISHQPDCGMLDGAAA